MPQASDYETLYQVEDALDAALSSLFTAASVTNHIGRATTSKTAPFVDVVTSLGRETGRMFQDNDSTWRAASWEFEVVVRAVTLRQDDSTDHKTYRAKVRKLMADFVSSVNGALTYHSVSDLTHAQSSPQISNDDDHDISVMQFTGVVDIKNDSWPAATP